jgi:lipoprotein-anchoring transpeptidase ErfK/SrfK
LIPVREIAAWGALVTWDAANDSTLISVNGAEISIRAGAKRVVVNRATQRLRAWQGERLVLESRVSTGRGKNSTPAGEFKAGPYKARMHFSSLYEDSPMPWSVQVNGNVFFHGFKSVPDYPASHGCIRMPLTGGNPARWLYEWIDIGTPVTIEGAWKGA